MSAMADDKHSLLARDKFYYYFFKRFIILSIYRLIV